MPIIRGSLTIHKPWSLMLLMLFTEQQIIIQEYIKMSGSKMF